MSQRPASKLACNATPSDPIPHPRILIVDDEDSVRGLHETVLSLAGYGTESVCNGEEALVMLATADFDVVITDRNMPVLDGIGLVRALRSGGSRIPVIMAFDSMAAAGELPADVRNEVAVMLPKPASLREMLTGIARSLAWRSAMERPASTV